MASPSFKDEEEQTSLLTTGFTDKKHQLHKHSRRRFFLERCSLTILLHGLVFIGYCVVTVILWRAKPSCPSFQGPNLIHSPARSALKYEKVTFNGALNATNEFRGDPRIELDQAWDRLLKPTNIRISREDLDQIKGESIPLLDGSGYAGELDVFHQLHCLKMIRHYLTLDLYPEHQQTLRSKNGELIPEHVDHCIDNIRQYIQCHADISVITYQWLPELPKPWGNWDVEHECVVWDSVVEWATRHSFDLNGAYAHPKFGMPFPAADGSGRDRLNDTDRKR